ncbi:MAG: efflux transporter outer membrane subunit [Alphaproteobacteria bacterium]|nr:RND transporter [Hyphomonas sp.]MBR9807298.1 efflux transporter outer membrane subunit [Alphaproteobacteria bacterium]|tara:strand:+ start:5689 stop:7056 length:1368 start_codon:yes stop_codon:yes gene_type:complete
MKYSISAIACLAVLQGCMVGPSTEPPAIPVAEDYLTQINPSAEQAMDAEWWEKFDDAEFSRVMNAVLEQNLDIDIALANVRVREADVAIAGSALLPSFDGFMQTQLNSVLTGGVDGDITAAAGGTLGYDVDIAGGNKRSVQAAMARLEAARISVNDVRRLVTRQAALQYIELRRAEARLELLQSSLDLQTQTLEIVQSRYGAGLSPALDVDRVAADLARTRAQKGVLEATRKSADYALSVLAGRSPEDLVLKTERQEELPTYQGSLSAGVPADLLRRRPDIRSAEAQLVAELASVGARKADLYPSLRLPGTIQASGGSSNSVAEQVTLGLSAILDVPLFDAGARKARLDAQRAQADIALMNYRASVLEGLQEVETALVRIEALQQRLDELNRAVEASESAYRQLEALYREGLSSFLDVLDSQRQLIDSRETVIDTQADLAAAIITLNASLGFGDI